MCGCTQTSSSVGSNSTNSPEYVTIDVLQVLRRPLVCVRDYGLWGQIGHTESEVNEVISKVDTYIASLIAIQNNPTYHSYYQEILDMAMKAMNIPTCL